MAWVVVERAFEAPVTLETAARAEAANARCLEGYRVSRVARYLSGDGKRMICVFDAPDAESVRNAMRHVGLPFERIYAATFHQPTA